MKLSPGCLLRLTEKGEPEQVRYYGLPARPDSTPIGDREAEERFLELFADSVKLQLQADVPVGISLSGGVDSSAIAAVAKLVARVG